MDPDQMYYADGQAGLDPCWSQMHYVGFVIDFLKYRSNDSELFKPAVKCSIDVMMLFREREYDKHILLLWIKKKNFVMYPLYKYKRGFPIMYYFYSFM
jgi:hypothetical protein